MQLLGNIFFDQAIMELTKSETSFNNSTFLGIQTFRFDISQKEDFS